MEPESLKTTIRNYLETAIAQKKSKQFDEANENFAMAWNLAKENYFVQEMKEIIPPYMTLFYETHRFQEGIKYHKEALEFATLENDVKLQARISTCLGAILWFDRLFEEALSVLLEAREYCEKANDKKMLLKTLTNLAIVESSLDNVDKSLEYYRELFALAEEENEHEELVTACLNLQALYFGLYDYERSIEYGRKGIEIARQANRTEEISAFLNNIGNVHFRRSEYEEALKYYLESFELTDKKNAKPTWLANNYMNIGMSHVNLKHLDKGEKYLEKALEIAERYPRTCQETHARALANLSIVLKERGQFEQAEKILAEIIPKLDTLDLGYNRTFFIQSYADVLEEQGKFKEAIQMYQKALKKTTMMYDETLTKEIANAQTKLEHDLKVREAELLRKKNQELEKKNRELENAQETIRDLERRNTIYAMAVTTNHELNQPLMIIRGNLELLIQGCDVENHSCGRYIDRISSAIDRIEKILTKYRTAERSTMSNYSENTPMVNFEKD